VTALRHGLGLAGLLVAAVAVVRDDPRIGWGAIALLAASIIVRLWARRPRPNDRDHPV
jgi:hypothetical protein